MRHDFEVNSAKFSPDGTKIVTASFDGTAKVWDGENGNNGNNDDFSSETGEELSTVRHDGAVTSANFSPDRGRKATKLSAIVADKGIPI